MITHELNGVNLYRAQDLLYIYGMEGKQAADTVRNWKVSRGTDTMISIKGKGKGVAQGTYLTAEQLESLEEYINPSCKSVYSYRRHGALCAVEQLLGIVLVRQYRVGRCRIDGYCVETNTAYMIDKPKYFIDGELMQEYKDKQAYIESVLGCTTVRITPYL